MKKYCVDVRTSGKYGNVVIGVRIFDNPIEGMAFAKSIIDIGCECETYFMKKIQRGVWCRAESFWDNE